MTSIGFAVSAALIQFLWQGAVVAALYWALSGLLRRPQARYVAGCVALAALALLPVVTAYLHYLPSRPGGGEAPRGWTLPLWSAGVLLFSFRPIRSLIRIRELRRKGTQPEAWIAKLGSKVAMRTGCTRAFRILICAISETPAAIGWLRPVILLPAATVAGLTVEQLETILAHEIAHIRRHDYLINVLQVVVETLLFYHPAVWWISSRIRFERELCCDDEVVRATGDALGYARALTTLERLRVAAPAPAVGSAGGVLSWRIRRLTGEMPSSSSSELWPAILALALSLLCVMVSVRWVRAQEIQDKVTVEVTRDEQGSITNVRVVSGPEYLRPIALMSVLQQPVQANAMKLVPELRVRTITFPDVFGPMNQQQDTLSEFFGDELAQAEKELHALELNSLSDREALTAARSKLARLHTQQELTNRAAVFIQNRAARPAKMWQVQVLRHQLETGQGNRDQIQQALAAAEKDLADLEAH
jgi:hypothetical protein